ncbi:MAG TPA: transcriptional regulator [Elusimicrobia bacterium]|nr:transcriptional regulator [Elusimicrobiota bacterium]
MSPVDAMKEADAVRAMRAAPMFSAVGEGAVRRLLLRCGLRRCSAGEAVFEAGQRAEGFFVVLSGRVKVFKLSPKGDEQILHLYGPGRTIGEAAMWAGLPYPAFASALQDSVLLPVPQATLRQCLASDPDLVMGMLAGLSAKLHEFARLIEELSLKDVPARLAGALLAESRRAGAPRFKLPQTKKELAAQLGTVPETLSRAFRKLKAAKLVELRGSVLVLRDSARLARFAGE